MHFCGNFTQQFLHICFILIALFLFLFYFVLFWFKILLFIIVTGVIVLSFFLLIRFVSSGPSDSSLWDSSLICWCCLFFLFFVCFIISDPSDSSSSLGLSCCFLLYFLFEQVSADGTTSTRYTIPAAAATVSRIEQVEKAWEARSRGLGPSSSQKLVRFGYGINQIFSTAGNSKFLKAGIVSDLA